MAADAATYGPREGLLAPLPAAERGVAVVLGASPDGKYLVYGSGTSVVVRSIDDPALCVVYSEHTAAVKVAKFAPTGKYIASGDVSGKVRVWAWTHPEHPLKYEAPSIGGEVEDLAWDSESKRIAVVGGGQAKARVFAWDTGSSLAPEVIPHAKKNITVDFKPSRPFKAVWGGEDFNLSLYAGPPFKYEKGLREHTNFVNCVRYAPDGSKFVSVSSDKKGVVYDGTTGDVIGKLDPSGMHAGSVYHCAWAPGGAQLATSGADKCVKVWDMSSPGAGGAYPCIATVAVGAGRPEDMQNSVVWPSPGLIVSLSLDGTLNFITAGGADAAGYAVARTLGGHQAPATVVDIDRATGRLYSGDMGGRVVMWVPRGDGGAVFDATVASGDVPSKKVSALAVAGGQLAVGSWDDKLRIGDATTGALKATIALPGQPKGVAASAAAPDVRVVATGSAVVVTSGAAIATTVDAAWGPTCVAISDDGATVAVGGNDKRVHLYKLAPGGALTAGPVTAEAGAAVSVVAVSPDGSKVAMGDATREVRLYAAADGAPLVSGRWMAHTTRVTGLKWNPSGSLLASVSSDRRIALWDPASDAVKKTFDLAHPQPFAGVAWAGDDALWTLGTDGVLVRRVLVL